MNEAAAFACLGLRKVDFHDTSGRVHSISVFSPMHIGLRLSSVKFSASEVDLVMRNTVPTTSATGNEKS